MKIVAVIVRRGRIVLWKPIASPVIIAGALPVWALLAMVLIGGPEVKYSLSSPIKTPASIPVKTAQNTFKSPRITFTEKKAPAKNKRPLI